MPASRRAAAAGRDFARVADEGKAVLLDRVSALQTMARSAPARPRGETSACRCGIRAAG
jgi:hypothetical protein